MWNGLAKYSEPWQQAKHTGSPLPGTPGRGVRGEGQVSKRFTPHPRPLSPEYRGEGSKARGAKAQSEWMKNRRTDAPTHRPTDLPTYRRTDLPTYRPTDLPTYRRTVLRAPPSKNLSVLFLT